jgi:uncharacterized protein
MSAHIASLMAPWSIFAPSERDTLRWSILTGETGQLHKQVNGTWTSTYGWTGRPDGKTV